MNEVEIIITGTNRAGKAFKEAQLDAKKLERSLDDTGKAAKKTGGEVEAAGAKAHTAFDRVRRDADEFEHVLKGGLGGTAAHFSIFDGLGTRSKNAVADLVKGFGSGAADAAQLFEKTFLNGMEGIASNPAVAAAGAAVAVAIAIPVGSVLTAAVGSAVALGIGGGAMATGIAMAAKDTRVQAAWGAVFGAAVDRLEKASGVFVDPMLRAARTVDDALADWQPHIEHAADALAPLLDDLSTGVAGLLDELGPGFDEAIDDAVVPIMQTLADHLPDLGNAIGSFMESLAAAGPGLQEFFGDFLSFTEEGITTLGDLIEAGSRFYEVMTGLGAILHGDVGDGFQSIVYAFEDSEERASKFHNKTIDVNTALGLLHGTLKATGTGAIVAADQFDVLSKAINQVEFTSDVLAGQMADRLLTTFMSLDEATLGFAESQTHLGDVLKENGRHLDIHTAKGQAVREAVLGVVQANIQQYDMWIKSGMAASDAAALYDTNTAALQRQLEKAGFTSAQIDGLIGKYRGVPDLVDTEIATHGLTEAITGLNTLLRQLLGLDGKVVDTFVNTTYRSYTDSAPSAIGGKHISKVAFNAHGGITGAAGGGARGGLTWVGEQGPELVRLPFGSTVVPHGQSEAMLSGASGGSRVNIGSLNVYAGLGADGQQIGAQVVAVLKQYEIDNGAHWRAA